MEHCLGIAETVKSKIETKITRIEHRTDLSEDEKRSEIINTFSISCAALAVQPIPFADIFILIPVQAYMGERLSSIRGMPLSEAEAKDLLKEIPGVIGLGMLAQQAALGLYKIGLPFLAGFTTIPLVYGLTYTIGRVMDHYLEKKAKGQTMGSAEIRNVWKSFRKGNQATKSAKNGAVTKRDDL